MPSTSRSSGPPIRVLIADDHPSMRGALNFLLETVEGIKVVGEAQDGEQAVRRAGELRPDVVLMDVCMPRMDGIEATERIVAEHPDMRIIALLMRDDSYRAQAMLAAGASACVTKGDSPEQLIDAIRQGLRAEPEPTAQSSRRDD